MPLKRTSGTGTRRADGRSPAGRAKGVRASRARAAAALRSKRSAGPARPEHDDPAAVAALVMALPAGAGATVGAIRRLVLRSCRGCTEGVKWNSASFYLRGWFATVNARRRGADTDGALLVLHRGAGTLSPRAAAALKRSVDDPHGVLTWRGADRAKVEVRSVEHAAELAARLGPVLASWAAGQRGAG